MPLDSMSKPKLHPRPHVGKCSVEKASRVSAVSSEQKYEQTPSATCRDSLGTLGLICPCHLPLGKAQTFWVKGGQGGGIYLLKVFITYIF